MSSPESPIVGPAQPVVLTIRWPDQSGPFTITVHVGPVIAAGTVRLDATRITVEADGVPITARTWRAIPVYSLARRAVRQNIDRLVDEQIRPGLTATVNGDGEPRLIGEDEEAVRVAGWETARDLAQDLAVRDVSRHRRRQVTPDLLRQVAEIHRAAHPLDARRAVADGLVTSKPTAGRWIAKARAAGLLAPAVGRRPTPTGRNSA